MVWKVAKVTFSESSSGSFLAASSSVFALGAEEVVAKREGEDCWW